MKFSKVVTWFLSCLVLLLGPVSASATIKVKSTKSTSSEKAAVCPDLACCKANPNATYSDGQPCSAVLKNSGHASEKTTTIKGSKSSSYKKVITVNNSKSNTYKEAEPTPTASTTTPKNSGHASEKTTTVNTSKSNTFKEAEPTPAASTTTPKNSGHASEKTTTINSTKGSTFKTTAIKSTKSNARFKEAKPTPGVTPTPKPAEKNINLNSSRTN